MWETHEHLKFQIQSFETKWKEERETKERERERKMIGGDLDWCLFLYDGCQMVRLRQMASLSLSLNLGVFVVGIE